MNSHLLFPQEPVAQAKRANLAIIKKIDGRAKKKDSVLGPCIREYIAYFQNHSYEPIQLLDNLTRWLVEARIETEAVILANMKARYPDKPESIPGAVANSLKRSAGTNYQALVSYALARFLVEVDSAWYLAHPVPKEFREALAITFTAGISESPDEEQDKHTTGDVDKSEKETEAEDSEETASIARVQPDVDILLRNVSWPMESREAEPVVLLSVKTSLADRGGQAARWKTYFDLATRPCPYIQKPDCAYRLLGISMENASQYNILHGIVTANIYKLNFRDVRYQEGELNTGQTRSNTYMFELKMTTRNDAKAKTPTDWRQFPQVQYVLNSLSEKYNLAK